MSQHECESHRSWLIRIFAKAAYYNAAANAAQAGILGMWMKGTWAVYKNDIGPPRRP